MCTNTHPHTHVHMHTHMRTYSSNIKIHFKIDKNIYRGCDWICKKGLICAIINIEKFCSKYCASQQCIMFCLHNFPPICSYIRYVSNSTGVLFNGLLAELPAILDSFSTSTTNDYIGVVGRGWWGAIKW